jgi:hypothetical protein
MHTPLPIEHNPFYTRTQDEFVHVATKLKRELELDAMNLQRKVLQVGFNFETEELTFKQLVTLPARVEFIEIK